MVKAGEEKSAPVRKYRHRPNSHSPQDLLRHFKERSEYEFMSFEAAGTKFNAWNRPEITETETIASAFPAGALRSGKAALNSLFSGSD